MKKLFLLIFVFLPTKTWIIDSSGSSGSSASGPNPGTLTPDQFERLFGNGEIYNAEHEEVSVGHISSSMEDLLKLCEYEKSVQDEVSQLPNSKIKSDYYQNFKPDVIYFASIQKLHLNQKYSRLRCLLGVKGLVIFYHLCWSGSIP